MKSFKHHIDNNPEEVDEDLNEKVKINEASMGDLLIGLGAAGGLLALKKGWDMFGKGSKLARGLAVTQKQKAQVSKDAEDKRKGKVDDAQTILDDPKTSEKAKAKAQKTLDKHQTDDERATAKIDKKTKDTTKKQTAADAELQDAPRDKEGNFTNQKDAQKSKDITGKAPPGWATSPEKSPGKGEVWTTKDMEKWEADAEKRAEKQATRKTQKTRKPGSKKMSVMQMTPAQKAAKKAELKKKKAEAGKKGQEEFQRFALHELITLTEEDRTQLLEELVLEETMSLEESVELQAIMALDDAKIKADINKKGQVVVKKRDLKKAEKILKKEFGGKMKTLLPKLIGEQITARTAWEIVSKARAKISETIDATAARELYLFIENERSLMRQRDSIIKNISRKMKSGKYDHKKAPKLWMYWVDSGAKEYDKLYSSPGVKTFDKETKMSVAVQIADEMKAEIELGNYS